MMRSSILWDQQRRNVFGLAIGFGILVGAVAPEAAAEQINSASSSMRVSFHIPAQPLAQALIAYGTATGFELYYNAALAAGRRSHAVSQTLPPADALRRLLEGTGLAPQITGPTSFILIPAPIIHAAAPATPRPNPYEFYFADIQERIGAALCHSTMTGGREEETFLRVWLASSGVISRAEIFGANENGADQRDLVNAVQGLSVAPPPLDMPQPVTLVVFPPASVWKNCRSADQNRAVE